jgi:pSer/pThr/pTyr-binding forkhead associated (FHA) protein
MTTKTTKASLLIEKGVSPGKEFVLTTGDNHIGRWDAENLIFPEIDLDSEDPEAKVSRRHARITLSDASATIEDLGSTNGTYVNRGRRLVPGQPMMIEDGDELILGKTTLRFRFQIAEEEQSEV